MTPALRPARPEDLPACVEMMATSTPWLDLGFRRDQCARILERGIPEIYIAACSDGTPLGFVWLLPTAFIGQPYVKNLCVAPAARGRGVGRALMTWVEAQAFDRWKAANLFLLVSDFNTPARTFYTHLGFTEVGHLPNYLVAGHAEIILRKTRGPIFRSPPSYPSCPSC